MGSIGAPEILVILVLALVVLGPERLPQAARTMGRWIGEARRITGSLQAEARDVVDEVMRPVNETATVATEAFTSTFSTADAGGSTAAAEPEPTSSAAAPSEASSDSFAAEAEIDDRLPADVPLPRPALPTAPVDPSLN